MDKLKQYPLYNSKNELIGTVELDNVFKNDSQRLSLYCFDCEGSEYEQDAWNISRVLNLSDPSMPSMYGKENS